MEIASNGKCQICGFVIEKIFMEKHITECTKKNDPNVKEEKIIQLLIEADGMPEYWIFVEGKSKATLQQLDNFLRKIWLECCGHLSAFYDKKTEISKRITFDNYFFKKGIKFNYEYDFGSPTYLFGKSINSRAGDIGTKSIRLLAQNLPLNLMCSECKEPAKLVCQYCMKMEPYLLCTEHAKDHKCASEDEYLPVVNSPRMGVCGYTG